MRTLLKSKTFWMQVLSVVSVVAPISAALQELLVGFATAVTSVLYLHDKHPNVSWRDRLLALLRSRTVRAQAVMLFAVCVPLTPEAQSALVGVAGSLVVACYVDDKRTGAR